MGDHFHFVDPEDPNTVLYLRPETILHNTLPSRETWLQERARLANLIERSAKAKNVGLILSLKRSRDRVLVRLKDTKIKEDNGENKEIWGTYMYRTSITRIEIDGGSLEELGLRVVAEKVPKEQSWCVS